MLGIILNNSAEPLLLVDINGQGVAHGNNDITHINHLDNQDLCNINRMVWGGRSHNWLVEKETLANIQKLNTLLSSVIPQVSPLPRRCSGIPELVRNIMAMIFDRTAASMKLVIFDTLLS